MCWSRARGTGAGAGRVSRPGWSPPGTAPSLTGLGDRAHLFSSQVSLATHVDDVLGLIEAEELGEGFVLVGHSYGGNVITGVADALRERVAHCIDLDAVVPQPGVTRWRWAD
jgi:pimeloyl-ACP methyl ester carboxylesterase